MPTLIQYLCCAIVLQRLSKNFTLENHIFNIRMLKRMTDLIWRDVNVEATLLFYVLFTASKDS